MERVFFRNFLVIEYIRNIFVNLKLINIGVGVGFGMLVFLSFECLNLGELNYISKSGGYGYYLKFRIIMFF